MIVIDGSAGEGGGQVLRTALSLSTITGQSTEIHSIRAARANPGLRPQHLTALQAAAAICGAKVEGAHLDSQTVRFSPGTEVCPGSYVFDVAETAGQGSAGAVGLVFQTVLLPLAMCAGDSHLTLRGGTHVAWAPSVHYLQHVFLPAVAKMGLATTINLSKWGFYPAGGGQVEIVVHGRSGDPLQPIRITERGSLRRIHGLGAVTNLPSHIPQRMTNRIRNLLNEAGLDASLEAVRARGTGPGAGVFLIAEYEHLSAGFTAYGRKGLPSEQVAQEAVDALLQHYHSGAATDAHLADQLVLPMALADGTSALTTEKVTQHLLTNLDVVRSFRPSLEGHVEGDLGEPGSVRITGERA